MAGQFFRTLLHPSCQLKGEYTKPMLVKVFNPVCTSVHCVCIYVCLVSIEEHLYNYYKLLYTMYVSIYVCDGAYSTCVCVGGGGWMWV